MVSIDTVHSQAVSVSYQASSRRVVNLAAAFVVVLIAASCSANDTDNPIPTSAPVLTTAPSTFTTTTTTLPPGPTLWFIQEGETLSGIAEANGITLEELLRANPLITEPGLISVGQQLVIPEPTTDLGDGEPGLQLPEDTEPDLPALRSTTSTTERELTTTPPGG